MEFENTKLTISTIELLEDLQLSGTDRGYALLCVVGHKKGSWLTLNSSPWREGDAPKRIPQIVIDQTTNSLEVLGIKYRLRLRDTDAGPWQPDDESGCRRRFNQLCDIFIADTQDRADELHDAVAVMDHKRIGHALDFPSTAVEAFGDSNKSFLADDAPKGMFSDDVIDSAQFILSKDNYEAELGVVRDWLEILKANSNIIYRELSKRYI